MPKILRPPPQQRQMPTTRINARPTTINLMEYHTAKNTNAKPSVTFSEQLVFLVVRVICGFDFDGEEFRHQGTSPGSDFGSV